MSGIRLSFFTVGKGEHAGADNALIGNAEEIFSFAPIAFGLFEDFFNARFFGNAGFTAWHKMTPGLELAGQEGLDFFTLDDRELMIHTAFVPFVGPAFFGEKVAAGGRFCRDFASGGNFEALFGAFVGFEFGHGIPCSDF